MRIDNLIFPFLIINIILSDGLSVQNIFPVGVFFYFLAILFALIVIYRTSKNILLFIILLSSTIIFSLFSAFNDFLFISFTSSLIKAFVISLASAIMVFKNTNIIKRQYFVFLLITIPIMILQITGVSETVHFLNTLFYDYGSDGSAIKNINLTNVLFLHSEEFVYNSAQARPPGIFHSNAILSPVLLGIAAYHFTLTRYSKISFTDFLILLSIVIVMSKISFIGIIIILFLCNYFFQKNHKFKKLFLLLIFFYFTYWFFFPGMFENNLNINSFAFSSYYRFYDILMVYFSNPSYTEDLISKLSSEKGFVYNNEFDVGNLSGIAKIVKYIPFIIVLILIQKKRIAFLFNLLKSISYILYTSSIIMLITMLICSFASNIWNAPIFFFFLGLILLPIYIKIFPHFFQNANRIFN